MGFFGLKFYRLCVILSMLDGTIPIAKSVTAPYRRTVTAKLAFALPITAKLNSK